MPTNRIVIDTAKNMGARIRDVATFGAVFREKLSELSLILGGNGYNGDASLITDAGLADGTAQTRLQNLVTQANNEMNGTASTQVNVGAATGVRQLLDALSTIG